MTTYRVTATHAIDGHAQGETFEADLTPDQERFFVLRNSLVVVNPEAVKELRNLSGGSAFAQYGFDSAGNVTSRDGADDFQFLYDGDDQQRVAVAQSGDELYYYDHAGRRFLAVLQSGFAGEPGRGRNLCVRRQRASHFSRACGRRPVRDLDDRGTATDGRAAACRSRRIHGRASTSAR